ncbi:hypothetical protein BDR06DRAFT_532224 [Suillus hirtellus]|nr:hypothetical protein BDR06DRAFT_532224 [Suillus hirtellus]
MTSRCIRGILFCIHFRPLKDDLYRTILASLTDVPVFCVAYLELRIPWWRRTLTSPLFPPAVLDVRSCEDGMLGVLSICCMLSGMWLIARSDACSHQRMQSALRWMRLLGMLDSTYVVHQCRSGLSSPVRRSRRPVKMR